MSTPKDGGPAFPQPKGFAHIYNIASGMTLRDYFAAKALAGELACQSEEYGFIDEYVHPENGAPIYGKNNCYAVKSGDGKAEPFAYDFTKPLAPVLKRTAAMQYAQRAYAMAEAMLAERAKLSP